MNRKVVKCAAALAGIAFVAQCVRKSAQEYYRIVPEGGVNENMYVDLNGSKQWISIYGKDRNNPVLLFLHGGPGGALSPEIYPIIRKISDVFTVVYWDQRNCGKSFDPEDKTPFSPELYMSDGYELMKYVLNHLNKEKLVIYGISWGSLFGANLALAHPELVEAFIGASMVADWNDNETCLKKMAVEWAKEHDDMELMELAAKYDPEAKDGDSKDNDVIRAKIGNKLCPEKLFDADMFLPWWIFTNPYNTLCESVRTLTGKNIDFEQLNSFFSAGGFQKMSLKGRVDYTMPFYLIQGDRDANTPYETAREYYEQVNAPDKAMYTMEGAGHMGVMLRTEEWSQNIHDIAARLRCMR